MQGIRGLAQQRLAEKRQRSVSHFAGDASRTEDAETEEPAAKGGKADSKGAGKGKPKAGGKGKDKGAAK